MIGIILSLVAMLVISAVIYLIVRTSRECTSWWVMRMKAITARLNKVHPAKLGIGFLVMIFVELGVILLVVKIWPDAIKGLYIFCTVNTTFVVITLWLDKYMKWMGKYPWLIIRLALSIFSGISWIIFPEWIAYNIVGVIGGIAFLSLFPALQFKRALAIGICIIIYDVVGVYITGWIIQLASGLNFVPPAVILIPSALDTAAPHIMMLGLGDIIFGGVMLSMSRLYGAEKQAFLGYGIGLSMAYALAKITNHGVPATMFIIPVMLLMVWWTIKRNNPALVGSLLK